MFCKNILGHNLKSLRIIVFIFDYYSDITVILLELQTWTYITVILLE